MEKLIRFDSCFVKIQKILLTALFLVMVVLMLAQVFWRYFLELPLSWSEEIARFLFIIITYLGAAVATYEKSHIEINITDVVLNAFSISDEKKSKAALSIEIVRNLITCLIAGLFSYYCCIYAMDDYRFEQVSTAVGMPLYYVSGFVFISMVIIVFHSLLHVLKSAVELKKSG